MRKSITLLAIATISVALVSAQTSTRDTSSYDPAVRGDYSVKKSDTLDLTGAVGSYNHVRYNGYTIALKDFGKKDTVVVFVTERIDTVQVPTLLYEGKGNRVYKASPGYWLVKRALATTDGRTFNDIAQPVIITGLDERKRKVKAISN